MGATSFVRHWLLPAQLNVWLLARAARLRHRPKHPNENNASEAADNQETHVDDEQASKVERMVGVGDVLMVIWLASIAKIRQQPPGGVPMNQLVSATPRGQPNLLYRL
jgi:hypothetical protein